jgi:hypothetical protein
MARGIAREKFIDSVGMVTFSHFTNRKWVKEVVAVALMPSIINKRNVFIRIFTCKRLQWPESTLDPNAIISTQLKYSLTTLKT